MSKLSNGVLILLTLVTVWCGASIAIGEYRLALFAIGLTSFVAAGAWLYNRVPPLIPNEERKKLWRDFGDALSSYESVLKNLRYASALKPAPDSSKTFQLKMMNGLLPNFLNQPKPRTGLLLRLDAASAGAWAPRFWASG